MSDQLLEISVDLIDEAEDNHRRRFTRIEELAESIRQDGLLQNLVVEEVFDRYRLIAGARRFRAAKLAGLASVRCLVKVGLDNAERVQQMFVENIHREDLTPIEEAEALSQLRALDLSQRQIADRVGWKQAVVSKRLALLKLPAEIQDRVDAEEMSRTDAVELARLADHPAQLTKVLRDKRDLPIATKVAEQLAKVSAERGAAKVREDLEAQGLPCLDWPESGDWTRDPEAPARPLAGQGVAGAIPVGPDDHGVDEPCYGVSVRPDDAAAIAICLEPDRHPVVQQTLLGSAPAEQDAPEPELESLSLPSGGEAVVEPVVEERPAEPGADSRQASRLSAARLLLKNPDSRDVHELVVLSELEDLYEERADVVAEMLGLPADIDMQELYDELAGICRTGTARDVQRLAFAMVMARTEQLVRRAGELADVDLVAAYLRGLGAAGYRAGDEEPDPGLEEMSA